MRRGFTFIEMLMVVVILSVFVAMAAPRFRDTYRDLEGLNHARGLATFLTYAQERAVVEGKTYRLQLNSLQGRYWLTVETGEDKDHFMRLSGRYGRTIQLPHTLSLGFDKEEIFFYPDGSSDPFTLSLKSREGREWILRNGKPFGYVRIEKGAT